MKANAEVTEQAVTRAILEIAFLSLSPPVGLVAVILQLILFSSIVVRQLAELPLGKCDTCLVVDSRH